MSSTWINVFRQHGRFVKDDNLKLQTENLNPLVLLIRNITLQKIPGSTESCKLCLTVFDAANKRFFGRTTVCKNLKRNLSDSHSFDVEEAFVVFASRNHIGFGIIAQIVYSSGSGEEKLLGWAPIFPFEEIAQSTYFLLEPQPAPLRSTLNGGSPLNIQFLHSAQIQVFKKLAKPKGHIQYAIQRHSMLPTISEFVPENVVLPVFTTIPGIESNRSELPPLLSPVVRASKSGYIERLSIQFYIQSEGFEAELCAVLNQERLLKDNKQPDGQMFVIAERRLHVGVHNGFGFLGEPVISHLISEGSTASKSLRRGSLKGHTRTVSSDSRLSSGSGNLQLRSALTIPDIYEDDGIALIFTLEYILVLETTAPNPPSPSVVLGWAAWSPFDEAQIQRWDKVQLSLNCGSDPNPNNVLCFNAYRWTTNESGQYLPAMSLEFAFDTRPIEQSNHKRSKSTSALATLSAGLSATSGLNARSPGQQPSTSAEMVPSSPRLTTEQINAGKGLQSHEPNRPMPPTRESRPPSRVDTDTEFYSATPQQILSPPPRDPVRSRPSTMTDVLLVQPMPPPHLPMTVNRPMPPRPSPIPLEPQVIATMPRMKEIATYDSINRSAIAIQQSGIVEKQRPISRSVLAYLSRCNFPELLDRHGETPDLVDLLSVGPRVDIDAELTDPLSTNEIIFQFMALTGVSQENPRKFPRSVFFTFQFYRFATTSTERLLVKEVKTEQQQTDDYGAPFILFREASVGEVSHNMPGYQVKFIVDPAYMTPGEQRLFLSYLNSYVLHFDAWDGDTLMHVGSTSIPLQCLRRRGRESVYAICELPLMASNIYEDINMESNTTINNVTSVSAVLYLKIANVGYPALPDSDGSEAAALSKNKAAIVSHMDRTKNKAFWYGGKSRQIVEANSIFSENPELKNALLAKKYSALIFDGITDTPTADRKRKVERLEVIKEIGTDTRWQNQKDKLDRAALNRDLQTIRLFREKGKHEHILAALYRSITTYHTIHPSLGAPEFFEFLIENPSNSAVTAEVRKSSDQLMLVTNPQEWYYFKQIYGLTTPLEENLFAEPTDQNDEPAFTQLFLRPREKIYIPFKYQTFEHLKVQKVVLQNMSNSQPLAILLLDVQPQPHVISHIYRFYHTENTVLSKYLRVPAQQGIQAFASVMSTEPGAVCDLRTDESHRQPDVYVKVHIGSSPSVKRFFILIFSDPFFISVAQIWQINIHAVHVSTLSTIQGQTIKAPLLLKSAAASHLVSVNASNMKDEVWINPSDPFTIHPSEMKEIDVFFRPLREGQQVIHVTAVDVELRKLMKSWLIYSNVRLPTVSRAFQVTLQAKATQQQGKRLNFTNPYNVPRTFQCLSSDDNVMTVKNGILRLDAGDTGIIQLRFAPSNIAKIIELYLFINDEDGVTEATYGIKIVYT